MAADPGMAARGMSAYSHGRATLPDRLGAFERALCLAFLAACIALFGCKLYLVDRININWDEFLYLSLVHAHARDAMTQLFQGAHAHLFLWVTRIPGDEIDQIAAARWAMVGILGVTVILIWLLGRRWLRGFPSLVPPLVYLASLPVVQHGGAFRVDSLLAPLVVGAALLLVRPADLRLRDWSAGATIGVAFALTLKTVLFLPMILLVATLREERDSWPPGSARAAAAVAAGRVLLAAAATAALLLLLHGLAIDPPPPDSLASYGSRVAAKTLLETPLFPQAWALSRYFAWQPLPWVLIALGVAAALQQKRFQVASLALSLLPIAVYRNSFPYFYVVMLAPASVLAGFAVQRLTGLLRQRTVAWLPAALICAIAAGLLYQAAAPVRRAWQPDQAQQRALLAAVHQVFPAPVDYVDCCAMVSSFPKANLFMSTWGMEDYHARGVPFMPRALSSSKPAFVLVNTPYLDPGRRIINGLLAHDLNLVRRFYPVYWGPIRVAGAEGRLQGQASLELTLPFEGRYRLSANAPVRINGALHREGDIVEVRADTLTLNVQRAGETAADVRVALFLASARPPPGQGAPTVPIFSPL